MCVGLRSIDLGLDFFGCERGSHIHVRGNWRSTLLRQRRRDWLILHADTLLAAFASASLTEVDVSNVTWMEQQNPNDESESEDSDAPPERRYPYVEKKTPPPQGHFSLHAGCWLIYEMDEYEPDRWEEAGAAAIRRGASDEGLSHLAGMRALHLQGCQRVTDAGLSALLQRSPDLRVLDLAMCTEITDATLHALGTHCPQLRSLRIARCVPDQEIPASHGPAVSAVGLRALADGCLTLEFLSLYGQSKLLKNAQTKAVVHELRLRGVQVSTSLNADALMDEAVAKLQG